MSDGSVSEQETRLRKQITENKPHQPRRKSHATVFGLQLHARRLRPIDEIHALNRELDAAGVTKFACGISPAAHAKTVRKQSDGKVLVTDGPYTETKEHMGGFWILECADMDEALAWARKGAISPDAVGEVRELLFFPAPEQ